MESKGIRFRMCEVCERNEFLTEEKIKEALATLSDKVIKYCYIFPLKPTPKNTLANKFGSKRKLWYNITDIAKGLLL